MLSKHKEQNSRQGTKVITITLADNTYSSDYNNKRTVRKHTEVKRSTEQSYAVTPG